MVNRTWRCLLFVFLLAILLYPVSVLEVRREKSGEVLFYRKVFPGDRFEFNYIHSVDKTPVSGLFLITSNKMIKPVETRFVSYGPGLPSLEGKVFEKEGVLKAMTEGPEMERFSFFVSPMTKQSLVFKDEKIDFSSVKEGEIITVKVKRYPLVEVLLKQGSR